MKKVVFAVAFFLLLFASIAFALVITRDTVESTTDRTAVFNVTTDQSTIITISYANETWYNAHSSDPLNIRLNNQYNDNIYKTTRTPTISGLSPSTKYYYQVYASTSGGLGAQGQTKSFTTAANQPPTATQVSTTDITTNSIKLLWTASSDVDFASYKIYRSENAGVDESSTLVTTITEKNNASNTDSQLTNNTTYYYKVFIVDSGGLSTGSNEVSAKTTAVATTTTISPSSTTTTTLEITTTMPQATTTTTTTTLPPTTTTTLPLFNYTGGCLANSPVGDISLAQQLHSPDAATNYAKKEFSLNTSSINESYSILDNLCTEAVYSEVLTNYCEPNDGPAILQEIAWKPDGGLWWSGRCLKSDGNRSPDQISCVKKECHCKVKASPKLDLRPWDSPKIMVGDREHSLNLKDTYCSDGVCKALINVDGIPKNFTLLNRDVGGSPEITLLPLFINSETDFLSLKVAPACAAANLPDLVVPEVSDAVFDSTSKYYKFSFTVKNIGNATSESFNVTVSAKNDTEIFSLQPNSKSNIIFNIENYPGLGLSPGKTKNLSVITQFYDSYGMVVGSGRLKVDIEITGKNSEIMFESNRDNNKLLNKNITVIKK